MDNNPTLDVESLQLNAGRQQEVSFDGKLVDMAGTELPFFTC